MIFFQPQYYYTNNKRQFAYVHQLSQWHKYAFDSFKNIDKVVSFQGHDDGETIENYR